MTNIDARVKVEAGKFRETCQSFVNYYDEKTNLISDLAKEVIDLKREYYELYRIFYKTNRWSSYDVYDYYRISTPYDVYIKVLDYIKMFNNSADGLVEMSAHDIKFLEIISNKEVDICITKLENLKGRLIDDVDRLKQGIQQRNEEILKEIENPNLSQKITEPEPQPSMGYVYLGALVLAGFILMIIFA